MDAWLLSTDEMEAQGGTSRLQTYRLLLLVASLVYFTWWFFVEALLPASFNPLPSRLVVVGAGLAALTLSYVSAGTRRRIAWLFQALAFLITFHYFYLFAHNREDWNWTVGAYITVMATGLCLTSRRALIAYALAVSLLYLSIAAGGPAGGVGFSGMLTVLLLLNVVGFLRRWALLRLSASSEKYFELFNAAKEGMALLENGVLAEANPALCRILGIGKENLIGRSFHLFVVPDGAQQEDGTPELPASTFDAFLRLRRGDGSIRAVEAAGILAPLNKGMFQLLTLLDVTDRLAAEEERLKGERLAYSRAVADSANRAKTLLLNNVSHEFRTPLTAILGFSGLLEDEPSPAERQEYLGRIRENGRALLRNIETLLELAELVDAPVELAPVNASIEELVRRCVDAARDAASSKDMKVDLRFAPGLPETAFFDAQRFHRILDQLLRNAVKFSGTGQELIVATSITAAEGLPGNRILECCVQDFGVGIRMEQWSRVFEPFTQEDESHTRRYGGLGTGLALAKRLANAMGGDVTLRESRVDNGSTFCVSVPIV